MTERYPGGVGKHACLIQECKERADVAAYHSFPWKGGTVQRYGPIWFCPGHAGEWKERTPRVKLVFPGRPDG